MTCSYIWAKSYLCEKRKYFTFDLLIKDKIHEEEKPDKTIKLSSS